MPSFTDEPTPPDTITLVLGGKKYGMNVSPHHGYDRESMAENIAEIVKRTYLQHYGYVQVIPEGEE